jgi:hypothetical protein
MLGSTLEITAVQAGPADCQLLNKKKRRNHEQAISAL